MKGRISNSFRHACLQLARSAECKAEKEKKTAECGQAWNAKWP